MFQKGKKNILFVSFWRVMAGCVLDRSYLQERMCNNCRDRMTIDLSHL